MITLYTVNGETFNNISEARKEAFVMLAGEKGHCELTKVRFSTIPDEKCNKCHKYLFDWQEKDGMCIGSRTDDNEAYLSVHYGFLCPRCAEEEADLEITGETLSDREVAMNEDICHLGRSENDG